MGERDSALGQPAGRIQAEEQQSAYARFTTLGRDIGIDQQALFLLFRLGRKIDIVTRKLLCSFRQIDLLNRRSWDRDGVVIEDVRSLK